MTQNEKVKALVGWMDNSIIMKDRYGFWSRLITTIQPDLKSEYLRWWQPFSCLDDAWMLVEKALVTDYTKMGLGWQVGVGDVLQGLVSKTAAEAASAICECIGIAAGLWEEEGEETGRFNTTTCPKCGNLFAWPDRNANKPDCPFCEQEFDEGAGQVVETVEVIENTPPTAENGETATITPERASMAVPGNPAQEKPQI